MTVLKLVRQRSPGRCKRLKVVLSACLILTVFMIFLEYAEGVARKHQAKPSRRTKKSRAGVGKDFSEFLLVIGAIMTCVIGPVFLFFLHSIYKDPAVPELARAGWKVVKDKLFSYLGGQQPAVPDSSIGPNGVHASSPSASTGALRRNVDLRENDNSSRPIHDYTNTGDFSWITRKSPEVGDRTSTLAPAAAIPDRYGSFDVRPDRWASQGRQEPLQSTDEHGDYVGNSLSYDYARSDRGNLRRNVEKGGERSAPNDLAPYSSRVFPVKADQPGLSIKSGRGKELGGAEFARAGGGSQQTWAEDRRKEIGRVSTARGATFSFEEEAFDNFGPRWAIDENPHLDYAGGDKHQESGIYKENAQRKRRTTRHRRARSATNASATEASRYDGRGAGRREDDDG